jgi:RNA polymerase sigma-70 factor (ECF subfamily)
MTTAEESPAEFAMSGERRELLDEALHTLKSEAREIIALRFFQRMSAREIAEIVGSTEGAVRTKLHRALNSLRKAYQDRKSDL